VIEEFSFANDMGYGNVHGKQLSAIQAIRHHCWMCQGGHEQPWRMSDGDVEPPWRPYDEVRLCPQTTCWLYPFRTGRDPNRAHHGGHVEALKSGRQKRSRTAQTT
jgi:hypothetical protein